MKRSFFVNCFLVISVLLKTNAFAQNVPANFEIDVKTASGKISPLWFGHNLEHTRSAMWHGLSAQLIQNRKFATKPSHSGQAIGWDAVGPDHTWYYLTGNGDNVYTRHYNNQDTRHRINEIQSQLIENTSDSLKSGISQQGFCLTANTGYEGRIALKSEGDITVSVRYFDHAKMKTYFIKDLAVKAGDWNEFSYRFNAPVSDENAGIEITIKKKGILLIGSVSLLPADNFYGMRKDVIARLKQISVPILRWPGGNFAGDYRWQDGLLPCDRRAPLMSGAYMEQESQPYTYGSDNHEVGTDEYIQLCREIGAEPFITVNLAWEDPDLCAAWVEYCNGGPDTKWGQVRVSRGHAEPYHVKYWSLGNELLYSHMEGGFGNNQSSYALKIKAVAQAMLKVDPTIKLTMSGYLDNREEMATVLPYLSSVSYHAYTGTEHNSLPVLQDNVLFREIVENPVSRFREIKEIYRRINQGTADSKKVSISFDEWNLWYAWYNSGNVRTAIHAASYLNEFCREASASGVSIGCYFQPVNEGAILVNPDSALLTATGQVFELYKQHHNNMLIPVNPVDSTISLISSFNMQTGELVITAVNLSPEYNKRITVMLNGIKKASIREKFLYGAESYLPGSKFTIRDLPMSMKNNKAEFVLPKLGIGNVVFNLNKP